jgi:hypothetical protein
VNLRKNLSNLTDFSTVEVTACFDAKKTRLKHRTPAEAEERLSTVNLPVKAACFCIKSK